jgi:hypothetical protein
MACARVSDSPRRCAGAERDARFASRSPVVSGSVTAVAEFS